uniref:Centromere protein O n=2 Tax=Musa acuminata TaxID=4641 RepID=A0A804KT75_MUSAM
MDGVISLLMRRTGFIVLAGASREGKETSGRERDGVRVSICGVWAMAGEKPPLEICKGVNDLDKVVALRDARGSSAEQIEQLRRRSYALTGEVKFAQEEDIRLETTRARLSNVLKRHEELKERLSRDSDKMIFERLQKEFEAARAAQSEEISLDGEQWNDGLLATIRERVHMEADRKAISSQTSTPLDPPIHAKITYKIKNKVICCLEGARIGIQFETIFAGEPCEIYHCVLESKSFLEKMSVIEHTVPFFLPIREAENDLLSSNAIKFIDYVGEILQSYVERREQVRLIKELYGNQIGELFHSLSYNLIEFVLEDFDCKVTVSLRYADLVSILPSRIRVLAWPVHPSKKILAVDRKESGPALAQSIPSRLSYAEDALRTMSLPEAYAEIVLNLPRVLQQMFPHLGGA